MTRRRWIAGVLLALALARVSSAQLVTRDVRRFDFSSSSISVSANSEGYIRVITAGRIDHITLDFKPETVMAWADTAEHLVNAVVPSPRGNDKLELSSGWLSESPYSRSKTIDLTRKIQNGHSQFALFASDEYVVNTVYQSVSKAQALAFIAALRKAVAAALELSGRSLKKPNDSASESSVQGRLYVPPAYFEFQVQKPVIQMPGSSTPVFPEALRKARIEGEVQAQFVVDTLGLPEVSTFVVLKSSNDLFSNSVKDALGKMRFYPAEQGGRRVRQFVQQTFQFILDR